MSMAVTIAELEAEITSLTAAYAALEAQDAAREGHYQQALARIRELEAENARLQNRTRILQQERHTYAELASRRLTECDALLRPCTHPTPEPGCLWCLVREYAAAVQAIREGS